MSGCAGMNIGHSLSTCPRSSPQCSRHLPGNLGVCVGSKEREGGRVGGRERGRKRAVQVDFI